MALVILQALDSHVWPVAATPDSVVREAVCGKLTFAAAAAPWGAYKWVASHRTRGMVQRSSRPGCPANYYHMFKSEDPHAIPFMWEIWDLLLTLSQARKWIRSSLCLTWKSSQRLCIQNPEIRKQKWSALPLHSFPMTVMFRVIQQPHWETPQGLLSQQGKNWLSGVFWFFANWYQTYDIHVGISQ